MTFTISPAFLLCESMRAADSLALDGGHHHARAEQPTSTSSCIGICMTLSSTLLVLALYNKSTWPQQSCQ